jgi:hypothetical protein
VIVMDDLRHRFASLDRVPVPDLWGQVEQRAAAAGPVARVRGVVMPVSLAPRRSAARSLVFSLAAAAIVLVLVAGAVAVGSGVFRLTAIVPVPSESASTEPSPAPSAPPASGTPAPSTTASSHAAPWVLFDVSTGAVSRVDRFKLGGIRADGSGGHVIEGGSAPVAWSPDGTRLLINDGHIRVAEVTTDIGAFTDTGITVPEAQQWEAFDFARDNERVVFVQKSKCPNGPSSTGSASAGIVLTAYVAETAGANCYVLSVIDLRTGSRTELPETLVKDQTPTQNLALELPAWSPDGTKIAYTRIDEGFSVRELWIVNADGSNPARVTLDADVSPMEPRWSPDGTRVSFTSLTSSPNSAVYVADIASGHVERVTTGSSSAARQLCCAEWTDNSHLRVADPTDPNKFWLATVGANPPEAPLLVDLTGALAANVPPLRVTTYSAPGDPGRTFFWQPGSGRP